MQGRALVIGIDHYSAGRNLQGCVTDATKISTFLESHGNGDPNFDVNTLISDKDDVSSANIFAQIKDLFSTDAETVLLYFAGHGSVDDETQRGFLETADGTSDNPGVDLSRIITLANEAYPKIKSTLIVLDCCQSGAAAQGEAYQGLSKQVSVIGEGVTILTACRSEQAAAENEEGHGTFTGILLDGLDGAASDVLGRITPAALYAYVDQSLGEWGQRPVYKANVQKFITVRRVPPKVPVEILRKLPTYFPTPAHVFALDPSYEEDRGKETEALKDILVVPENFEIFRELQKLCNNGLVKPSQHDHMWHSAVYSGGCRLTATGAHYRCLALKKKL